MSVKIGNPGSNRVDFLLQPHCTLGNPFMVIPLDHNSTIDNCVEGFRRYLWLVACRDYDTLEAAFIVQAEMNLHIADKWAPVNPLRFQEELDKIVRLSYASEVTIGGREAYHAVIIQNYVEWRHRVESKQSDSSGNSNGSRGESPLSLL